MRIKKVVENVVENVVEKVGGLGEKSAVGFEKSRRFGRKVGDLDDILECADSTARSIIGKLRDMDVVVPVSGHGKGMYRFRNKSEK